MRSSTILVFFLTHPSQCEPSFHHCCRISPNSQKPTHSMIQCSDSIRAVLIVKEMLFQLKWLLRFHHLAIWISPTPPIELSLETKNIFSIFQFWYPPHFFKIKSFNIFPTFSIWKVSISFQHYQNNKFRYISKVFNIKSFDIFPTFSK